MRSPTSTARMVTVPAKGATTRWNETNSSSRRILARLASTLAAAVSRAAAFSAASCSDTDAVFSSSFQRSSVVWARWRLAWASEFRAGLLELLVQVGRFNLSQQLSGLNMRADVGDPAFKIAIGSRKNGGFQP